MTTVMEDGLALPGAAGDPQRGWLKQASAAGGKGVKQIVFDGVRLDVMSVRRWRERVLAE